jgi:WD40 repeat protein
VVRLAISPDGARAAALLEDGRVALIDAADLHTIVVREHPDTFVELAFSPTGRYLATSSGPRTLVWRSGDGALVHTVEAERIAAFSPDEALLAVGSIDGVVRLWSTADWALRGELPGHAGAILALGFRADGQLLISAGYDRTAKIWDLEQLREIFEVPGAEILSFASFAAGGERFYAGGDVRLDAWNARPLELDREALARLVACRVPLRLEGSALFPAPVRCDDAR